MTRTEGEAVDRALQVVLGSGAPRCLIVAEAARAAGFSRHAVRALGRGEVAASVVCSRPRIRPGDVLAWTEGSHVAATAPPHSGDRIGVRKAPGPGRPAQPAHKAEFGGVSVERVQRRTGTVWCVGWRENGHPHQLAMFPTTVSDERWRDAMCHETGR